MFKHEPPCNSSDILNHTPYVTSLFFLVTYSLFYFTLFGENYVRKHTSEMNPHS